MSSHTRSVGSHLLAFSPPLPSLCSLPTLACTTAAAAERVSALLFLPYYGFYILAATPRRNFCPSLQLVSLLVRVEALYTNYPFLSKLPPFLQLLLLFCPYQGPTAHGAYFSPLGSKVQGHAASSEPWWFSSLLSSLPALPLLHLLPLPAVQLAYYYIISCVPLASPPYIHSTYNMMCNRYRTRPPGMHVASLLVFFLGDPGNNERMLVLYDPYTTPYKFWRSTRKLYKH